MEQHQMRQTQALVEHYVVAQGAEESPLFFELWAESFFACQAFDCIYGD
ncbi:hypothetical protein QG37_07748 [Candidozyma auris]|uniref:Uncharacterized protein n=1 Tax=Candidozyma auris TaxID=498019 RepID=A0A0L0NP64_CANAR|nr:hypothetical protein QG37_07748 [[Candida] auris]